MDPGNSRLKPFPTTQWSLIMRAAAVDPADREKALAEICELYWPPVYAFIRSRGNSPHDAEDLTQGLFAELLERNDFARADANHGRLRSYLLTAASNHLNSAHRRENRQKRGGGAVLLSFDAVDAEARCLIPEPMDDLTPDRVFERQWAITVMEGVVSLLAQRYADKGQTELFNALKPFINTTESLSPQTELAQRLGMTDAALRVAIHRLRQRYGEVLRQTVKTTLGHGENVDDEIACLMAAFQ
ncbi:MAG: sigma-70 family RNA polymerase sigma factor [Verrucomicrobiaceae bacterium]|nr:sigma-70 family RNA polymerase sigma factor [Verrucomicrobiaceae bacterium]